MMRFESIKERNENVKETHNRMFVENILTILLYLSSHAIERNSNKSCYCNVIRLFEITFRK